MGRQRDGGPPWRVLCWAAGLLLFAAVSGRAQEVPDIEARRQAVEKQIQDILKPHESQRAEWSAQYLGRLRKLQKQLQEAGDLDGWMAVKKEMRRFDESPVLGRENLSGDSPKLRQLQEESLKEWGDASYYVVRRVVLAVQAFDDELAPLQKQLTTAGDIEQALKVKAARDRISALPEVVDAFNTVQAWEQEAAKQKTSLEHEQPKNAPPPAASTNAPPPAAPLVVVSRKLPDSAPVTFRKSQLSKTWHSPDNHNIIVVMDAGGNDDVRREGNVVRKTETAFFRIALHTSSASGQLHDIKVMAQAFGMDLSGGKKIMPVQASRYVTPLDQLDNEDVFLVYPPVMFNCEKWPSHESGQEFYGVAVTVFDSHGEVLYQGTTRRGLESFALTTLP